MPNAFQAEQEEIRRSMPPAQKGLTLTEVRKMKYLSKVWWAIFFRFISIRCFSSRFVGHNNNNNTTCIWRLPMRRCAWLTYRLLLFVKQPKMFISMVSVRNYLFCFWKQTEVPITKGSFKCWSIMQVMSQAIWYPRIGKFSYGSEMFTWILKYTPILRSSTPLDGM